MRLIALDPALTMGVAITDEDGTEFSVIDIHGPFKRSAGDGLYTLRLQLDRILPGANAVAIEEATPMNMLSARTQYAVIGAVQASCAEHDVQYVLYNVSTVRAWTKRWLRENLSPREQGELALLYEAAKPAKQPALMRHHFLYGPPYDHNIADASALLGLAASELRPCLKS